MQHLSLLLNEEKLFMAFEEFIESIIGATKLVAEEVAVESFMSIIFPPISI